MARGLRSPQLAATALAKPFPKMNRWNSGIYLRRNTLVTYSLSDDRCDCFQFAFQK